MPVKLKPAKRGDLVASSFHIIHEKLHPVSCLCDGGSQRRGDGLDALGAQSVALLGCWFVFVEREGAGYL